MNMLRAEWIGKRVRVAKASNKSLEGIIGTIINETKHLVQIKTDAGEAKSIPKRGTQFAFEVNGQEILIDGTKAEVSPEERIKLRETNGRNM